MLYASHEFRSRRCTNASAFAFKQSCDFDKHGKVLNVCALYLQEWLVVRYLDAIVSSHCAISCDSSYLRAYQRRASAYESLGDISAALQDLQWIINSSCDSSSLYREARGKTAELQRRYKRSQNADPYRVLGLRSSATTAEVKSQFRKLALQFHPDKTNNHEGGSEVFRLISQANSILSDEHRRRRFDATRLNRSRFDLQKRT